MKKFLYLLLSFAMANALSFAQEFEVKPVDVNTKHNSEMAPFVKDSVLYFVSNRRPEALVGHFNQNMEPLFRWYSAPLLPDGKTGKPKSFMDAQQCKWQNGPFCISADGRTVFATQTQPATSPKQTALMNLWAFNMSQNGMWNKSNALFTDAPNGSIGQPSISDDGRFLFFTSSHHAGFGQTDIFVCEKVNGKWSEPKNLGKTVNSPRNELFPYYHPSGKLYFASDGRAGMGGLDIFYTYLQNGEWVTAIPLPAPINSAFDDYAICLMDKDEEGFFTSDRQEGANIFSFKQTWPTFESCEPQTEDNYCFTLQEDGPYNSDTLPIAYRWDFGDGKSAKGKEVDHCFPGPGSYHVTLNAVDTLLKEDLLTVADYQLDLVRTEQVFITAPQKVKVGQKVNFDADKSYFTNLVPSVFYWDFGDGQRTKGKIASHAFMRKGTYTVKCGTISDEDTTQRFCSSIEIIVTE